MDFFSKLFNKKINITPEYANASVFIEKIDGLLAVDKYVARSDYAKFLNTYEETFVFFKNARNAQTLNYYCKKNNLSQEIIDKFLSYYEGLQDLTVEFSLIQKHNLSFINKRLIEEKDYLDNILSEVDKSILLDNDQRTAVLSNEDYTLIIAGAGAGKTTTVAAKVRYLVEKENIKPNQILVVSFTNKAVGELKERINDRLSIPCPITTFHSAGYTILRKQETERKKIVDDGYLFNCVNDYLKGNILTKPNMVEKLIMFFGTYFTAPYEGSDVNQFFNYIANSDCGTLKSHLQEYSEEIIDRKTHKKITILDEELRSMQEVRLANFLYLNQIDYRYEKIYPYHILKAKKPYTPDFYICQDNKVAYIEHFGISESGENSFFTLDQIASYRKGIIDKINLHKKHKTNLICTYSEYNDGRDFIEHLKEELIEHGFELRPRKAEDVYAKLVDLEENKYISKLSDLITTFIGNFKTNGYTVDDFYRFERVSTNVRNKLFLEICRDCYLEYQRKLAEENAIDFQDMINDSARIIREKQISKETLDFKYIIVDEYQDISRQRYDLTKELSKLCDAKIIAVGDDWQSIFAFSGSDLSLFTQFCKVMGYGKEIKITNTYRNAQEVIDIAGNFIQKNNSQIKKRLISPKHIQKPVVIQTYSEEYDKKEYKGKGGKFFLLGKELENLIGKILEQNKREGKSINSSILLIGRFGFDARNLCHSEDFVYDRLNNKVFSKKYPDAKLDYLTAHSSKGLGYDNVIIVNVRNETYGFPAKIQDDPVMKYVIKEDNSIEYAEERRLFYVAMTRTKNRVFMLAPKNRPSEFVLELIKDYPNVTVHGDINKGTLADNKLEHRCPVCGHPLQLKYKKNYGLKLWVCLNEPEICGFLSNDLSGGQKTIQKCDWCKDGYLIVKKATNGTILGCTNYKENKSGCNRILYQNTYKLNDGFEQDLSADKPTYEFEIKAEIPKLTKKQPIPTVKSGNPIAAVHKITHQEAEIEQEGFKLIADDEGNILTNVELLKVLRRLRAEIAQKEKRPAYTIIGNKGLVSLATYKPETREEFIGLYGLGEITYDAYGKIFIDAIKDFFNK